MGTTLTTFWDRLEFCLAACPFPETFGDPEAKFEFRGGTPNVVVYKPDIHSFKINKDHDFIILGCDGIFDKLSNEDVSSCVWNIVVIDNKEFKLAQNVHYWRRSRLIWTAAWSSRSSPVTGRIGPG